MTLKILRVLGLRDFGLGQSKTLHLLAWAHPVLADDGVQDFLQWHREVAGALARGEPDLGLGSARAAGPLALPWRVARRDCAQFLDCSARGSQSLHALDDASWAIPIYTARPVLSRTGQPKWSSKGPEKLGFAGDLGVSAPIILLLRSIPCNLQAWEDAFLLRIRGLDLKPTLVHGHAWIRRKVRRSRIRK